MGVFIFFIIKKLFLFILLAIACLIFGLKTKKYRSCSIMLILLVVSAIPFVFPMFVFFTMITYALFLSIFFYKFVKINAFFKWLILGVSWVALYFYLTLLLFAPIPTRKYQYSTYQQDGKEVTTIQVVDNHSVFARQWSEVSTYIFADTIFYPSEQFVENFDCPY